MRYVIICLFLVGCGSGKTEVTSSNAVASEESIFQDWNVAIPSGDLLAIQGLADISRTHINPDHRKTFEDIVLNGRLNLSGLKAGTNYISGLNETGGCNTRIDFTISIYTSGQIIISRKASCGEPTRSLYYKYSVSAGRVTVCGYDDANYTLQRGCMSN